jgi:hypothetical protein
VLVVEVDASQVRAEFPVIADRLSGEAYTALSADPGAEARG